MRSILFCLFFPILGLLLQGKKKKKLILFVLSANLNASDCEGVDKPAEDYSNKSMFSVGNAG